MKKLLTILSLAALVVSANAQNIISTNITGGSGTYVITTSRAKVYAIEATTTNAVSTTFFDNDNANNVPTAANTPGYFGTNVVTGAYISKSTYATNIASSFTNMTGYVVWSTNIGLWTVTTTNSAATNSLPVSAIVTTAGAETRVNYVDATFVRGIVARPNGNVNLTIYYRLE
jgi:hypothetical protein